MSKELQPCQDSKSASNTRLIRNNCPLRLANVDPEPESRLTAAKLTVRRVNTFQQQSPGFTGDAWAFLSLPFKYPPHAIHACMTYISHESHLQPCQKYSVVGRLTRTRRFANMSNGSRKVCYWRAQRRQIHTYRLHPYIILRWQVDQLE